MADNELIYYDPEAGLYRADDTTIKTSLKQVITDAYGEVYLDDNYPDGIVINGLTSMISQTFDAVETIYNMLDLNNAEGVALDTLGNIRNDFRKSATYSYLTARITITLEESEAEDLVVKFLRNTLVLKDENNNNWSLTKDTEITVSAGETVASGVATFKSKETGVLQRPSVLSISSISNTLPVADDNLSFEDIDPFIYGEDTESDIAFRNRMNKYSVFNSSTIRENLSNNLLDLEYIKDVKVYYNNSTLDLHTKGDHYIIPSARMLAMIKPIKNEDDKYSTYFDDNTDNRDEVLNVISDYKGLGTLCWLPSSIADVTINASTFSSQVSDVEGTYTFIYFGQDQWIVPPTDPRVIISTSQLETDYGIVITEPSTLSKRDTLIVTLTIENSTPSTTYIYYQYGNVEYKDEDEIASFIVPGVEDISMNVSYSKTDNFDSTLTDKVIGGTSPTQYYTVSEVNVMTLIDIYIDSLGIGEDLTAGKLIRYLRNNTNEVDINYVQLYYNDTTLGPQQQLINNDKIFDIEIDNIAIFNEQEV